MSNILDEVFKNPPATLPYSFTMTDFDLGFSPLSPSVHFATGTLTFERGFDPGNTSEGPIAIHKYSFQYIDSEFSMWQGHGLRLKAPSMTSGGWANELVLKRVTQGNYILEYHDQTHPISSSGPFPVEAYEGDFFGQLKTAVLVGRYWRGAVALVLGLDGAYKRWP